MKAEAQHPFDVRATQQSNFCRVFELPKEYPEGFCFGGGKPVTMMMVDWFNPWPPDWNHPSGLMDKSWAEVCNLLLPFMRKKEYVKPGRQYLILTDFGGSVLFTKEAS